MGLWISYNSNSCDVGPGCIRSQYTKKKTHGWDPGDSSNFCFSKHTCQGALSWNFLVHISPRVLRRSSFCYLLTWLSAHAGEMGKESLFSISLLWEDGFMNLLKFWSEEGGSRVKAEGSSKWGRGWQGYGEFSMRFPYCQAVENFLARPYNCLLIGRTLLEKYSKTL